ncbi:MAG: hypothetical protein JSV86_19915, partial [Gemmatimonadota bacterium]
DGDGDDPVLTEEDYEILADLEERLDAIEATLLELPDPALLEQTLRALDELCRDLRGDLTREQADLVLERVGYAITYRAAVSPRADRYPHLDQWLRTVPVLRLHEVWAHAVAAAPRRVQARVAAAPSWIQRALAAGDDAALLRRYDALSPLAAGCTVASLRRVVPVFTGPWWAHRLDRPRPAR